ncbi:MAG TPA: hypothetical protein VMA55_09030, partial [Acidovorax sp.]|nr:hypothetical protein [Acidovorax sp.]
ARIALQAADLRLAQGDLFPETLTVSRQLWESIRDRALITAIEEEKCRDEISRLRWLPGGVH